MELEITVLRPEQCSREQMRDFSELLERSREVSRQGLAEQLANAVCLVFVRDGEKLVAICGVKRGSRARTQSYFNNIGLGQHGDRFHYEWGWLFISFRYRGLRLSCKMLEALGEQVDTRSLYALIREGNTAMMRALRSMEVVGRPFVFSPGAKHAYTIAVMKSEVPKCTMRLAHWQRRYLEKRWLRVGVKAKELGLVVRHVMARGLSVVTGRRSYRVLCVHLGKWERLIRPVLLKAGHQVKFLNRPEGLASTEGDIVLGLSGFDSEKDGRAVVTSAAIGALTKNKESFNNWLVENGFGDHVPRVGGHSEAPYIAKAKEGLWGKGCMLVKNVHHHAIAQQWVEDGTHFTQDLINSHQEYSTHILFARGEVLLSHTYEFSLNDKDVIRGGDDGRDDDQRLVECPSIELFTGILRKLGYEGICCFDYKVVDEHIWIFELNARMGASVCFVIDEYLKPLSELVDHGS